MTSTVFGQTSKDKEMSNTERFSERSGLLIKKEFADVGEIKKCRIQTMTVTDLVSNESRKALRFEYDYRPFSGLASTKIATLDNDEVDGLDKTLRFVKEKVLGQSPTLYTEYNYTSKGGFGAGCFYSKGKWSIFLKLEKYDSNSYIFLDPENLDQLITFIDFVKGKM